MVLGGSWSVVPAELVSAAPTVVPPGTLQLGIPQKLVVLVLGPVVLVLCKNVHNGWIWRTLYKEVLLAPRTYLLPLYLLQCFPRSFLARSPFLANQTC
jgi:hypothetical protein